MLTRVFDTYDPQEILQELLSFSFYDRERGGFVRTATRSGSHWNQKIGELVGSLRNGYLTIMLLGFCFRISHLVWVAEYGSWPQSEDVDHRDQVRDNNYVSNLRDTTRAINKKNGRMSANNTTGYTGVVFNKCKGKYQAQAGVKGRTHFAGYHNTPEEAAAARQAMIDAHPEWGFTERHGI